MLDAANVDHSVHLKCGVIGYQFPDIADNDWCLVRIAVRQGSETFEMVDPALEASELLMIRDWFRALGDDRLPRYAMLTFTENCLGFEFLARDDAGVRFAVHLSGELRPPFQLRQLSYASAEWCVVFHFNPERLAAVADEVEATLKRFPVRGQSS